MRFHPPEWNTAVNVLVRGLVLPAIMRCWNKVVAVDITREDRATLADLRGSRVVLCPNHPTRADSDLALHLSTLLGQNWNYLAAHNVFSPPAQGWLLRQLGVYSVIRGGLDAASYRMTRRLLAEGKRFLVLFPEGETCGHNDRVMPFQPGVAQFAFWALDDLVATHDPLPPLYLVPIGLKYRYLRDMRPEIDRSLARLAAALDIASPPAERHALLAAIAEAVLVRNEARYSVVPPRGATFDERINATREAIAAHLAAELGVSLRPETALLDRVLALFHAVHSLPAAKTPAERAHHATLLDDVWRALRFVAATGNYVAQHPTAERYLEIIGRLEWEVLGRVRWRGPRRVLLRLGAPINAADWYPRYRADRRAAVAEITSELHSRVTALVAELGAGIPTLD